MGVPNAVIASVKLNSVWDAQSGTRQCGNLPRKGLEQIVSKIIIRGRGKGFEWQEWAFNPAWVQKHTLRGSDNCVPDAAHQLLVTASAFNDVKAFIGWQSVTGANTVEQGGLLAGEQYRDSLTGFVTTVVKRAFPVRGTRGSMAFLTISAEGWLSAHQDMDAWNTKTGASLVSVGWFHTHPNSLPVFMSGTDMQTQCAYFPEDYQYAMVFNPQRGEWCAYRGRTAANTFAVALNTDLPTQELGEGHKDSKRTAVDARFAPLPGTAPQANSLAAFNLPEAERTAGRLGYHSRIVPAQPKRTIRKNRAAQKRRAKTRNKHHQGIRR